MIFSAAISRLSRDICLISLSAWMICNRDRILRHGFSQLIFLYIERISYRALISTLVYIIIKVILCPSRCFLPIEYKSTATKNQNTKKQVFVWIHLLITRRCINWHININLIIKQSALLKHHSIVQSKVIGGFVMFLQQK